MQLAELHSIYLRLRERFTETEPGSDAAEQLRAETIRAWNAYKKGQRDDYREEAEALSEREAGA